MPVLLQVVLVLWPVVHQLFNKRWHRTEARIRARPLARLVLLFLFLFLLLLLFVLVWMPLVLLLFLLLLLLLRRLFL